MLIYTSLFSECLLINSINSTVCGAGVKMLYGIPEISLWAEISLLKFIFSYKL